MRAVANFTSWYLSVVVPTAMSFALTLAAIFFLSFFACHCFAASSPLDETLDESRLEDQLISSEKITGGK